MKFLTALSVLCTTLGPAFAEHIAVQYPIVVSSGSVSVKSEVPAPEQREILKVVLQKNLDARVGMDGACTEYDAPQIFVEPVVRQQNVADFAGRVIGQKLSGYAYFHCSPLRPDQTYSSPQVDPSVLIKNGY